MTEPRRILIVRLSALGDVIMASGLIPSLRSRYPDAHLAWLTESPAAPLIRQHPQLDEVIVWPRGEWRKLWRERRYGALWQAFRRFRAELRARRFDLALDAQGLLKSGLWGWLSGAPRRIGLRAREGAQWLATERLDPPKQGDPRIGAEYRALARHVGAADADYRLDLRFGDAVRAAARRALDEAGVTGPYAVLCPFTTRPQKHWFEDRWAELAQRLAADGLTPVLLGGPGDREAASRIHAAAPVALDLAGRLPLDVSVALIEGAALLVGVDTGLTHAGSAYRVPTIALFGSTRPYADPDAPRTVILYDALPCSPCRRNPTCGGRFDCMRAHTVERVHAQARTLLGLGPAAVPVTLQRREG